MTNKTEEIIMILCVLGIIAVLALSWCDASDGMIKCQIKHSRDVCMHSLSN